jgi:protein-disulfide isomerase
MIGPAVRFGFARRRAASLTTLRVPARPAAALALALLLAACGRPHPAPVGPEDLAMGSPAAKVTIIEYASVACPACADFNNTVLPAFKARYIDTGQVRWVLREALTGDTAFAAAGFLTARCAGPGGYFPVVDAIFHAQGAMYASGQPERGLLDIARRAGLSPAQFQACIGDPAALAALNARWRDYSQRQGIRMTPTFVIGHEVHEGEMSLADLQAAVAKAQEGRL